MSDVVVGAGISALSTFLGALIASLLPWVQAKRAREERRAVRYVEFTSALDRTWLDLYAQARALEDLNAARDSVDRAHANADDEQLEAARVTATRADNVCAEVNGRVAEGQERLRTLLGEMRVLDSTDIGEAAREASREIDRWASDGALASRESRIHIDAAIDRFVLLARARAGRRDSWPRWVAVSVAKGRSRKWWVSVTLALFVSAATVSSVLIYVLLRAWQ